MRHWVNFGLLFSFLALGVTGVLSFVQPFSLLTTRIHIFFGALTLLLVVLHLVSRTKYFSAKLSGKSASRKMVAMITAGFACLLGLAIANIWPVKPLIGAGYESRHKAKIVRSSPLAGFLDVNPAHRFIAREPNEEADTAVALMVRFREGLETPPAMAVWAETKTGTIIETLYLDEALAYDDEVTWQGIETRRHKLLPIWRHRHTVVSGVDPHGKVDAFAGATPTHSFTLDQNLKLGEENGFVLCVEVNAVRDPNKAYPDPELGQPSLFYTAFIQPKKDNPYALLEITAHGGQASEHGALDYDFEGVDTAKTLIDLLLAKTGPPQP